MAKTYRERVAEAQEAGRKNGITLTARQASGHYHHAPKDSQGRITGPPQISGADVLNIERMKHPEQSLKGDRDRQRAQKAFQAKWNPLGPAEAGKARHKPVPGVLTPDQIPQAIKDALGEDWEKYTYGTGS